MPDIYQPIPQPAPPFERMLSITDVETIVSRKKSWIHAQVKAGQFPPPDDGRWFASEIEDYLRRRREGMDVDGVWQERAQRAA